MKIERKPKCGNTKVGELISEGKWNEELIEEMFDANDRRIILRIPLSIQKEKDRVYRSSLIQECIQLNLDRN